MRLPLQARRLLEADAAAYHQLRARSMEGLAHPDEPRVLREIEAGAQGIAGLLADYTAGGSQVWGVFDDTALAAAAGLSREYLAGYGGIGVLWGVFVLPRYRGTPASRLLMNAIIGCCGADSSLRQLRTTCPWENTDGLRFLYRFGFEIAPKLLPSESAAALNLFRPM